MTAQLYATIPSWPGYCAISDILEEWSTLSLAVLEDLVLVWTPYYLRSINKKMSKYRIISFFLHWVLHICFHIIFCTADFFANFTTERIYRHLINYVYKRIWSYTWFVYDRLQIFVRASILRKWSIEPLKLIQKFCQEEKERKEKRKKSGNNKTVCSEAELVSGLPILSCLFPKAFWILHSVAIST